MLELFRTSNGVILNCNGLAFDVAGHSWKVTAVPLEGALITAIGAVAHLLKQGAKRLPVGVIGPNDASPQELGLAEESGAAIAALGLPMICGGRGGCMEAAARGHANAGGLVIGVLPSSDWRTANEHVAIPIASGLGEARNAIIASACFALIAVGGGHGTLSEMALALKLERLVIALPSAAQVHGAVHCTTVAEAVDAVALRYLGLGA